MTLGLYPTQQGFGVELRTLGGAFGRQVFAQSRFPMTFERETQFINPTNE